MIKEIIYELIQLKNFEAKMLIIIIIESLPAH